MLSERKTDTLKIILIGVRIEHVFAIIITSDKQSKNNGVCGSKSDYINQSYQLYFP